MLQWLINTVIPIALSTTKKDVGGNGGQDRVIPPIESIEAHSLGTPSGGLTWSSTGAVLTLEDSQTFATSQNTFVRIGICSGVVYILSDLIPGAVQVPDQFSLQPSWHAGPGDNP